ncbi:RSP_2648 family PIN domain-containing protein [Pseudooceanicola onchidii]|uniref:RSP_2648 family PIN domain-containing protein n=1 Tax=Pseudooceanicola onchidii TaxID=2562279 RepID=UPI0010A9FBFB|nr:PIN domain-containing protein [Pseudooceanicola onchidii]
MKLILDACVLYPTVMREMLLAAARAGIYTPLWSDRILEEWARAAARIDPAQEAQARGEIAMLSAHWPRARVQATDGLMNRLWLPDPADIHVLAAAVAGSADGIVTMNAKDFPRNILAEEGLTRADPDTLLLGFFEAQPDAMRHAAETVLAEARRLSGEDWTLRSLMKKARLPRLGKALEQA